MMRNVTLSSIAVVTVLALSGCGGTKQDSKAAAALTVVPSPSTTATAPHRPLAAAFVNSVLVSVYSAGQLTSSVGCGCKVNSDATDELFPAGTPVMLLRIGLRGEWGPSQGDSTTQDVTGTTLTGTRFDGRPEAAVLDATDGIRAARTLHLPWLPSGLFATHSRWTVPNSHERSFAAAWYVPAGVDRLLLTVDIPSEGQPTHLFVDLPAPVVKMLNTRTN
jgi:hypothetical protein